MNEDIKKKWLTRDRVTRAMTVDGLFRAAVIHNPNTVRTAQEKHNLDAVSSIVLARALTGASLMASFLNGEERVVVHGTGDGVISTVYAEAMQVGETRGYVTINPQPAEGRNSPLGEGLLKIQRVLYGNYEPVTGIVELRRGDVTSDLGYYLTQSEQIPSAFVIDLDYDENDMIRQSVGLLVQAMPGARPEDIFKVYDTIDYLERLTEFADKGYSPEEMLRQIMPTEITVMSTSPVDYFCRCSHDRFKSLLLTLGLEEITGMEAEGQNELVCQYCSNRYYLTPEDFTELKEKLLVNRN
ncbi:MAG: Hsp33 family molecular chaperone HslO [Ignavibacteria bacterium]|nr:Hsp33 family molecular chaperone HslO [Ignavibacteria bacterium]MBP6509400.1 Hsp33 family molecular chaperone HslO [Candidatus Kapabacteria bacterium]MBK6418138.1 Hsp33 family molecular chaperone HslO [Ignavibacteria bacterium]MBK7186129.1 Hsp33 family molecular chaperone HslO [Ignavibacteria bacterium]MBK7412495.1 Hsp33 family molecular chaperone HslO [Ignavibacteria bacterium]